MNLEEISNLASESHTWTEFVKKSGIHDRHRAIVCKILRENGISVSHWDSHRVKIYKRNLSKGHKIIADIRKRRFVTEVLPSFFIENSPLDPKRFRGLFLTWNRTFRWIEYKCEKCGNLGSHLGEPLKLQLDHKNGDSRDNRLENLRFLCPNCHSQTDTFTGRNIRKIQNQYGTFYRKVGPSLRER